MSLFFDDEKTKLLNQCTVAQLRQIAKDKKVKVEPGFFSSRPTKDDYITQLYDEVSLAYLRKFLSEGATGGVRRTGGKRIAKRKVISELEKFQPTGARKTEAGYERDLLNWARGRFGKANVTPQYSVGRTRVDLIIGGIGVELKVPRTARQLMTLRGQVEVYEKHFGKNLVVMLFRPECDPGLVRDFQDDMRKRGVNVIVRE